MCLIPQPYRHTTKPIRAYLSLKPELRQLASLYPSVINLLASTPGKVLMRFTSSGLLHPPGKHNWIHRPVWHVANLTCEMHRADSRLAPNQWETSLQTNTVSHWLGVNLKPSLVFPNSLTITIGPFQYCNGLCSNLKLKYLPWCH